MLWIYLYFINIKVLIINKYGHFNPIDINIGSLSKLRLINVITLELNTKLGITNVALVIKV